VNFNDEQRADQPPSVHGSQHQTGKRGLLGRLLFAGQFLDQDGTLGQSFCRIQMQLVIGARRIHPTSPRGFDVVEEGRKRGEPALALCQNTPALVVTVHILLRVEQKRLVRRPRHPVPAVVPAAFHRSSVTSRKRHASARKAPTLHAVDVLLPMSQGEGEDG
jgi:hypothetical protein